MRNLDELSRETALNGDGEIEGFNFPNTNNPNISSTEYSSKLKGAGRMSYLMKVNSIDSSILKSNGFNNLKATTAAEKIQSIFRGSNFRKKFYKNKENFIKKNIENNQAIDENFTGEKNQKNIIKKEEIINNDNNNENKDENQKKLNVKNNQLENDKLDKKNINNESEGKKLNNDDLNKGYMLFLINASYNINRGNYE
jgi:hypothetical protein